MKNVKLFEDFTSERTLELNESINFGSYVFTSRTPFQEFDEALPDKGESVYCVFLHNNVEINGQTMYLGQNTGGLKYQILGLWAERSIAKEMYDSAVKSKKDGDYLSVSIGELKAKTKFRFDYSEFDGYRAKGIVK